MSVWVATSNHEDEAVAQVLQSLRNRVGEGSVLVLEDGAAVERLFRLLADEDVRVVHLLSPELLRDRVVLNVLLERMAEETNEANYSNRVVPVLQSREFALSSPKWQRKSITDYWLRIGDEIGLTLGSPSQGEEVDEVIDLQETTRFISSRVGEYHDLINSHLQLHRSTEEFVGMNQDEMVTLFRPVRSVGMRESEDLTQRRALLEEIYESIRVPPAGVPEFPPSNPRFPATPAIRILAKGYDILLKDEGQNPTGSHKDRLAWETIVFYKHLIRNRLLSNEIESDLPALSMISSGSAAVAVQTMLHHYRLPALRVIVDERLSVEIVDHLRQIGCQVFTVALSERLLSDEDVKKITDNESGFDITSRATVDSAETKYYDWLTYEILNLHPKWIFVPVGTGDLYGNIARIIFDSLVSNDDISNGRLKADKSDLNGIALLGATTSNSDSFLDKLYAPFTPELGRVRTYVSQREGYFDRRSGIFEVSDDSVKEALNIASSFGITTTEPSGIAGLGLFMEKCDEVPRGESIVVVNTGRLYLPERTNGWNLDETGNGVQGASRLRSIGSRLLRGERR